VKVSRKDVLFIGVNQGAEARAANGGIVVVDADFALRILRMRAKRVTRQSLRG